MMNLKSFFGGQFFAAVFGLWSLALPAGAQSPKGPELRMFFTNDSGYDAANVWITLQRHNAKDDVSSTNVPGLKYGTNSFKWKEYSNTVTNYVSENGTTKTTYDVQKGCVYAESVPLSEIIKSGGITFMTNCRSVGVYVSYGAPMPVSKYVNSGASPVNPSDPAYGIAYQNFEITYLPNDGDACNITAINWFAAKLGIASYASANATGQPLQEAAFHTNTATIYQALAALSHSGAVITATNGRPVRVVGPNQYGASQPGAANFGKYPTFDDYFAFMAKKKTPTILSNLSGYNTVLAPNPAANQPYTNLVATFVLTNYVSKTPAGYAMEAKGTIVTKVTPYTNWNGTVLGGGATKTEYYNDIVLKIDPSPNLTNLASSTIYYGDVGPYTTNVTISGHDWKLFQEDFPAFVNPDNQPAAKILGEQMVGELASAFATGLAGSRVTIPQFGDKPLGSLGSGQWWDMTNVVAFSQAQTNPYYSGWGDVIYKYSSNTIYGLVYSDRFNHAKTLINVRKYNGPHGPQEVKSLMITVGAPLAPADWKPEVKKSAAAMAATSGVIAFAFLAILRKRRRPLGGRR